MVPVIVIVLAANSVKILLPPALSTEKKRKLAWKDAKPNSILTWIKI